MGSVNSPTRLALDLMLLTPPHTIVSQRVAKIMVGLLMPALGAATVSAERIRLNERMVETAFALAEYRAEHEGYPETLEALMPQYIAALPDDTFAEKPTPIRYRRTKSAYMLWSVGKNGIDDNGRNQKDGSAEFDDFLVGPAIKNK